jgi:hypothetical protein
MEWNGTERGCVRLSDTNEFNFDDILNDYLSFSLTDRQTALFIPHKCIGCYFSPFRFSMLFGRVHPKNCEGCQFPYVDSLFLIVASVERIAKVANSPTSILDFELSRPLKKSEG